MLSLPVAVDTALKGHLDELLSDHPRRTKLRESLQELLAPVSVEFYGDLFELLEAFTPTDLERFTGLWRRLPVPLRSAFVAFIVTGESDPDGEFLKYLDDNEFCQQAVDLAFAAHLKGIHDVGRALEKADEAIADETAEGRADCDLMALLHKTEEAEATLESVEREAATVAVAEPIVENMQAARDLVDRAATRLRALCGR